MTVHRLTLIFLWILPLITAVDFGAAQATLVDSTLASRFANLALDCIHREYPNKISHVLQSEGDAGTPRVLHPAFYGCFDWHSSVHGHWLLVRLLRKGLDLEGAPAIEAALQKSFTASKIEQEVAYFQAEGRDSFERPYGMAWFLQLMAELRRWNDPRARQWLTTLQPLETAIAIRIKAWLPKLAYPIRLGTHNQSAFAFGLMLDWSRAANDREMESKLVERSLEFHLSDLDCPLSYEPSGEDFLSPCLMEADLMRRILPQGDFSQWLQKFLPNIPLDGSSNWLEIGIVKDPADGKLVHLDGVNLSRAWNLENIASALPSNDPRVAALLASANQHRTAGLASVSGAHYEGGHWLASFATYLVTSRGRSE